MPDYNTMVFSIDKYENRAELMADIAQFLDMLATNYYMATYYYDGVGNYIIDYVHDNWELTEYKPVWISGDEYEYIIAERREKDEN